MVVEKGTGAGDVIYRGTEFDLGDKREIVASTSITRLLREHTHFKNEPLEKRAIELLRSMGVRLFCRGANAKSMGIRLCDTSALTWENNPHAPAMDTIFQNLKQCVEGRDMPAHTRKALDKKPDIDIILMLNEGQSLQDIAIVLGFSNEKGVVQTREAHEDILISWELRGNNSYTHAYLTVLDKNTGQFILFDLFAIPHGKGPFDANNRFGRGATYKDVRCIGEIIFNEKTDEARVNFNRDFYNFMNMPCMTLNTRGEGMDVNQYMASYFHALTERICWRKKDVRSQLKLDWAFRNSLPKKLGTEWEGGNRISVDSGWADQIQRDALRVAILATLENTSAVYEFLDGLHTSRSLPFFSNLSKEVNTYEYVNIGLLIAALKIEMVIYQLARGTCKPGDAQWLLSLFDPVEIQTVR